MEVKEIKILRKIFLTFTVIFLFVFFLIVQHEGKQAEKDFSNKNFQGIVQDIRYKEFKWGYPEYKVNEQWLFFGSFFEYSEEYIDIRDSLAKEKGTKTVEVYSKDKKGKWKLEYPLQKINIDSLLK